MLASDQHKKTLEAAEAVRLAVAGQAFLDVLQSVQIEMPELPPVTVPLDRECWGFRPLGAL